MARMPRLEVPGLVHWVGLRGNNGQAVFAFSPFDEGARSHRWNPLTAVRTSPLHRGRRQQLWAVEFTDADGRALARSQVRLQNIELPTNGGE